MDASLAMVETKSSELGVVKSELPGAVTADVVGIEIEVVSTFTAISDLSEIVSVSVPVIVIVEIEALGVLVVDMEVSGVLVVEVEALRALVVEVEESGVLVVEMEVSGVLVVEAEAAFELP